MARRPGSVILSIDAVIFDMDGTLIDTEKLNVRFWIEAGRHFGIEIAPEDIIHIRSLESRQTKAYLEGRYAGFDYEKVRDERRILMKEHVDANGVELKPGVKEALGFIKGRGMKTAVASASRIDHVSDYLRMTGIIDYFDRIITTSCVERGKPFPDVYEYACSELGEEPSRCIAVEDAPNGIRSAFDAGCRVVFVPDLTPADDEIAGKAHVLESLDLLPRYLEEIDGRGESRRGAPSRSRYRSARCRPPMNRRRRPLLPRASRHPAPYTSIQAM